MGRSYQATARQPADPVRLRLRLVRDGLRSSRQGSFVWRERSLTSDPGFPVMGIASLNPSYGF